MRYEKETFENKPVLLDGNEFFDCTFRRCEVRYAGGPYTLINARFEDAQFAFGDAADRTLAFLRLLASAPGGREFVMSLLDNRPVEQVRH